MPEMKLETTEDVLREVSAIFETSDASLRVRLYRELLFNALKCKRDELDTLDLKVISRAMAEFRHAARVFKPFRHIRKISIFGSARVPESDPYFQMAVDFARGMAAEGFMVITGAASGIMRAGNLGAGADRSFGVNILLPFEQAPNEVMLDHPNLITFRYFFTRKLFFVMEAHAVALFPGGFGTQDEGFETLTLLQTGKAPPMPLVLMEQPGDDYWETWSGFIQRQMLARGYVSPEDLSLYRVVHSVQEGVEWTRRFYSTYHSLRQVRDRLVLRLERELDDDQVEELNSLFSDLVSTGRIEKTPALPAEADEPELLSKPRIAFAYNHRSASRLHQMVHAINDMGMKHARDGATPGQ